MSEHFVAPSGVAPSVIVGIDGSRSAVRAALWAIDEAAGRDIPLRLISVVSQSPADEGDQSNESDDARQLVAAEQAIHHALDAIEATNRAVKLEVQIVHGIPSEALRDSSAAMICVGAVGLCHFDQNGIGSTAAQLVADARCPTAIIRGPDRNETEEPGWVVVELDETPASATVLACGVEEARLRNAPLRVLGSWQSRYTDVHQSNAVADNNRLIRAQLDRRLEPWKLRYPDLNVRPVAVRGGAINYLAKNAKSIQLVVVGAGDTASLRELLGPTGSAALRNTSCSVLVSDRQRLL